MLLLGIVLLFQKDVVCVNLRIPADTRSPIPVTSVQSVQSVFEKNNTHDLRGFN